jgi:alpha-L-rhamnosidase
MDITASSLVESPNMGVSFPITVAPMRPREAQHFVLDFGREVIGWIELDVEARGGAAIDLLGFEAIQEGAYKLTQLMKNTMRYVCRDGRQMYRSIIRRRFWYLLMVVHRVDSDVTIHGVITRMATYPGVPRGGFRCSDSRLNQIWEISAYTLRLCSEDTFTDCPTYEQTLWIGDAYTDVLIHHMVQGDARYVGRTLKLIADSLQRMPIANSQVPGACEDSPIPNWNWLWAMACRAHYQFAGDAQIVNEVYHGLAKQAQFIDESRNGQGLFAMPGAWHFLDWTALDTAPDYMMAHENCLVIAALCATAELAEVVGEMQDAARWRAAADELCEAVNRVFWSERMRAYVDSMHEDGSLSEIVSQPTNVCALFARVAPGDRAQAIAPYVVDCPDGWTRTDSPFMLYFNCEVLAAQGR